MNDGQADPGDRGERADRGANTCPECGEAVQEKRVTCPKCGYEYRSEDYAVDELDDEFSTEMPQDDLEKEGMTG